MNRQALFLISTFALVAAATSGCTAHVIHVDRSNMLGPWDGTAAHPFETIQDGLNAATLDGEDIVEVHGGVYTENVVMKPGTTLRRAVDSTTVVVQGSPASPTIQATDRCAVAALLVEGGSVGILLELQGTVHKGKDGAVIVSNCRIESQNGLHLKTLNNLAFPQGVRHRPEVRILDNWILGPPGAGTGIRLELTGPTTGELSVFLWVKGNVVQDKFSGLIVEATGQGPNPGGFVRAQFTGTIENNLIFGCAFSAIHLDSKNLGSAGPMIFNNTIADNGQHAIVAATTAGPDGDDASTHPDVVNNILARNGGYGYVEFGKKTSAGNLSHNLFFNNTQGHYHDEETGQVINTQAGLNTPIVGGKVVFAEGSGNVVTDPVFVQGDFAWYGLSQGPESAGAYFLEQSGTVISPAVDAGLGSAYQAGLHLLSTRVDFSSDSGTVDLGFHYTKPWKQ